MSDAFEQTKVDLVVPSPDRKTADLFILAGPWTNSETQLKSLLHKIDTYLSFALDGQMLQMYPELKGLPWRIVIQCNAGLPTGASQNAIEQLAAVVKEEGGDLILLDASQSS
jgi:hypothetical protein